MSDITDKPQMSQEAQDLISMYEAAQFLPEELREDQERLVAQLAGEIGVSQEIDNILEEKTKKDIEIAEKASLSSEKAKLRVEVSIDFSKLGWVKNKKEPEIVGAENVETEEGSYLFVDLTSYSRATEDAKKHLDRQGVLDKLVDSVKQKVVPELLQNVKNGKKLRPVSIGNRNKKKVKAEQSLDTKFPGYKEGVQGTNNRAIIVLLDEYEGKKVVGLAALYDHEDQDSIYRSIFIKQKK